MSATITQRLVPIRPSPHKRGLTNSTNKNITVITNANSSSPATLTPPKTGIKRKLSDPSPERDSKCKRRINFGVGYVVSPAPVAVARRNQRERNRVKQVNNGFATLRNHIPGASKAKKISKVDTLKQAVDYINALTNLLQEHDNLMSQAHQVSQDSVSPALTTAPAPPMKHHAPHTTIPPHYTTTTTLLAHAPMQPLGQYRLVQYPSYYYSENISPIPASVYPLTASAVSPACSENSAASPTPSYDSAYSSNESVPAMTSVTNIFSPTTSIPDHHHQGPYDLDPHLDEYTNTTSPEDDELLEAISLWQQGDGGF